MQRVSVKRIGIVLLIFILIFAVLLISLSFWLKSKYSHEFVTEIPILGEILTTSEELISPIEILLCPLFNRSGYLDRDNKVCRFYGPIKFIPLFSRKSYSSIESSLKDEDYKKYPSLFFAVPKRIDYSMINPKTFRRLEFDKNYGGYLCCGQATFYVYVDKKDNIFWVETYQANLDSTDEDWYGPFKYKQ